MRQPLTLSIALCTSLLGPPSAAAQTAVQGCEPGMFLNRTAASADRGLTWSFSIASDPERCMEIAVGQQVFWNGSLGAHPLDAQGGDTPNPISAHSNGLVTFTAPGTFGYECGLHPVMKGAIRVVPAPAAAVPSGGDRMTGLLVFLLIGFGGLLVGARATRKLGSGATQHPRASAGLPDATI